MKKANLSQSLARSLLPQILLVSGLAATALLTFHLIRQDRVRAQLQFQLAADRAFLGFEERIHSQTTMLRAGSLAVSADSWVNAPRQLKNFAEEMQLRQGSLGLQVLGLSARLGPDEKKQLEQRRANFKVWPDSARSEYHAIVGVETLDGHTQIPLGYDLGSEPARRKVMQEAADSGAAVVTARGFSTLEADSATQSGFLVFFPLYRNGKSPETLAQRRQELRGYLFAAFQPKEIITAALDNKTLSAVGLQIFDDPEKGAEHLIYTSAPIDKEGRQPRFQITRAVSVGGRSWQIALFSRPESELSSTPIVIIPILGVLLSSLFFFLSKKWEKALETAEQKAWDFQKEQAVMQEQFSRESMRFGEEACRVFSETVPECVVTLDGKGTVLTANEMTKRVFGRETAQLVGQSAEVLMPEIFKKIGPKEFFEVNAAPTLLNNFQIAGKHQNGSDLLLEISIGVLRRDGGALLVCVMQDASVRNKTRQALFHAQKMQSIGSLASGIAHDFNNVFTAILSHLDLATSSGQVDKPALEYLEYAKTSASRGAELVNRLLAFSRHSAPLIQQINPAELVKEVIALLHRSITRRIEISSEIGSEIWPVKGEESQIKQVLITLCLNARDAMVHGGKMTIELVNTSLLVAPGPLPKRAGNFTRITVTDNGSGMSKDILDRLFEPFFTTKEAGKGAGLGLWIAKSIVDEHGGWIEVESTVGQGSKFHVLLPRSDSLIEAQAPFVAPAQKRKASFEGNETVLVADDDAMVRNLMRAILGYRGYKIFEAADGAEVLEKVFNTQDPIDLVLLDLEMPKMDGWEALALIRQKSATLPVILCSGSGAAEHFLANAKAAGATRIIEKPFANTELLRTVRETLDSQKKSNWTQIDLPGADETKKFDAPVLG